MLRTPINQRSWRSVAVVATVAAATLTIGSFAATTQPALAKAAPPAFGPKEAPLGRTYSGWLAEWGKWAFAGPAATNPLLALQACDTWVQPDPGNVWFLSAGGPGSFAVTCSVPTGIPIAVTPGGTFGWDLPGKEARVAEYLKTFATSVRKPTLSVDGVKVDASKYLVTTQMLKTKIIASEFGPNSGPDVGEVSFQAKGWMLVLKGLKAGRHSVVISDELAKVDDQGNPVLVNGKASWEISRVTFTLNVGAGPAAAPAPAPTPAPAAPAAATSTVAPAAAAIKAPATPGTVLFQDNFDNPKSGWLDYSEKGINMGYLGGKYKIDVEPKLAGHVGPDHVGQPNLRNSRTELEVEILSVVGAFALHCYDASAPGNASTGRVSPTSEPEHFYVGFSQTDSGGYVSIGGKRTNFPGTKYAPGVFRGINRVALECKGEPGQPGTVKAFLNDTLVFDAVVPAMPAGSGVFPSIESFRGIPVKGSLLIDNMIVKAL